MPAVRPAHEVRRPAVRAVHLKDLTVAHGVVHVGTGYDQPISYVRMHGCLHRWVAPSGYAGSARNVMVMATPRSLADDLRQRDDVALARLLRRRPDLMHPVPSDITALTTRTTTGPSIARCLDGFDSLHLHVLRCAAELTAAEPATEADLVDAAAAALGPDSHPSCAAALADLRDAAVVWGRSDALRAVHSVRDLVATAPVPPWPRPVLTPRMPGDVAGVDVDEQGALHARATIARVRDLLDEWSMHPPAILRSGGLSLRDFSAATRHLHADWRLTSLTIEVARAARLVTDDQAESPHWMPTDHYDAWLSRPAAEQWLELVDAWLTLPRLAWLADEKTQVLSAERDRRAIPILRSQVLDLLVELAEGTALDLDNALALLDDRQPRRGGELRRQTVESTISEATELGLLGAGALTTAGRLLLAPTAATLPDRRARTTRVTAALAEALPADIDQVLIQADLTIVAPGPMAADISRTLRLLADIESRGHATVYRITESSLRRALDAGWDATAIHRSLEEMSRTPVPQPLSYLVDDVARRHGAVRVGTAFAYVRCDNPETLTAVLTDRNLRTLGLSRIAETVLVSQAPAAELIAALRTGGYAPAAEDPDGTVVIRRPQDHRAPAPRPSSISTRRLPEDALVDAAIRSLRAGDRARSQGRGPTVTGPAATPVDASPDTPSMTSAAIVSTLRRALADNRPLWIGYADTAGTVTQQIVDPIRLGGGVLTAFDHRTEQVRSFSVSRVTGVAPLTADVVET
jgi:hypothetical protein